jgi:hypothetical protein
MLGDDDRTGSPRPASGRDSAARTAVPSRRPTVVPSYRRARSRLCGGDDARAVALRIDPLRRSECPLSAEGATCEHRIASRNSPRARPRSSTPLPELPWTHSAIARRSRTSISPRASSGPSLARPASRSSCLLSSRQSQRTYRSSSICAASSTYSSSSVYSPNLINASNSTRPVNSAYLSNSTWPSSSTGRSNPTCHPEVCWS